MKSLPDSVRQYPATNTIPCSRGSVPVRSRGLLGFDPQDQTRIATAVSEIARNAFQLRRRRQGRISRSKATHRPQCLLIRVSDSGPGIADLNAILEGRYRSQTGMGLGIIGARRLMDHFEIESAVPGRGTTSLLKKFLPRNARR